MSRNSVTLDCTLQMLEPLTLELKPLGKCRELGPGLAAGYNSILVPPSHGIFCCCPLSTTKSQHTAVSQQLNGHEDDKSVPQFPHKGKSIA